MKEPSTINDFDINIHDLLEQRRQVAAIWSLEDVQNIRPDLTEDQAWDVLRRFKQVHDCNFGLTWDLLACVADDLFPEPETPSGK